MANEHDKRYKKLFSHPALVQELLQYFVNEDFIKDLDFSHMERLDKSFITDGFKEKESDIIWKLGFKDKELFIYLLIEFQSTVDEFMALRISRYIHEFYEFLALTGLKKLPPVFPVLLYNGDPSWSAADNLQDLIDKAIPGKYVPHFTYYKIIENEISKDVLLKIKNVVSAIFYVENSTPKNFGQEIKNVIQLIEKEHPELIRLFRLWLGNLFETTKDKFETEEITSGLDELMEVKTMFATKLKKYSEKIKKEGKVEGRVEGRVEEKHVTAQKMLEKGFEIALISEITGLSTEEIAELQHP